jgi:hypothetical protein
VDYLLLAAQRDHRTVRMIYDFIKAVDSGKESIMIGAEYVVISRETYDKMKPRSELPTVLIDEMGSLEDSPFRKEE